MNIAGFAQACFKLHDRERGGALIYVLFILTFVGLVLPLILMTVTQGQRHLVQYEQKQAAVYLSEGALEVALYTMETYQHPTVPDERGIYYFVRNHLLSSAPDQPFLTVEIDGHSIAVAAQIDHPAQDPLTVRIYDLKQPSIYRTLLVPVPQKEDGEGEGPSFADGRPHFDLPPNGNIYEEDAQGEIELVCVGQQGTGAEVPVCLDLIRAQYGLAVEGRLLMGGGISLPYIQGATTIHFSGQNGVFVSGEVATSSNQALQFHAQSGDVLIGDGAVINSSNALTIQAPQGHVVLENGTLNSSSYNHIIIEARQYISLKHIQLNASRDIRLKGGDLRLTQSTLTSMSHSPILGEVEQGMLIDQANLSSANRISLTSGTTMTVRNSSLKSSSHTPIILSSGGEMVLTGSSLDSSSYIEVTSAGAIDADQTWLKAVSWNDILMRPASYLTLKEAHWQADRDIEVQFATSPALLEVDGAKIESQFNVINVQSEGVTVSGRPAQGCVKNGTQQICP